MHNFITAQKLVKIPLAMALYISFVAQGAVQNVQVSAVDSRETLYSFSLFFCCRLLHPHQTTPYLSIAFSLHFPCGHSAKI